MIWHCFRIYQSQNPLKRPKRQYANEIFGKNHQNWCFTVIFAYKCIQKIVRSFANIYFSDFMDLRDRDGQICKKNAKNIAKTQFLKLHHSKTTLS